MTIVGVVADDDELFRTGLRSIYSALDDIGEEGALQLAMRRGWRATRYQNYSLLYLVMTMQVAYRQGYELGIASRRAKVCRYVLSSVVPATVKKKVIYLLYIYKIKSN